MGEEKKSTQEETKVSVNGQEIESDELERMSGGSAMNRGNVMHQYFIHKREHDKARRTIMKMYGMLAAGELPLGGSAGRRVGGRQ